MVSHTFQIVANNEKKRAVRNLSLFFLNIPPKKKEFDSLQLISSSCFARVHAQWNLKMMINLQAQRDYMPAKDKRSNDGHSSLGVPSLNQKKKLVFFSFFRNNNDGSCGRHWREILRAVISPTKRIRAGHEKKREKKNVVLIGGRWGKRTTTFFMSFQIVSLRNLHITIIQFITLGPPKKICGDTLIFECREDSTQNNTHKSLNVHAAAASERAVVVQVRWTSGPAHDCRVLDCWCLRSKETGTISAPTGGASNPRDRLGYFLCVVSYDIRIRERR